MLAPIAAALSASVEIAIAIGGLLVATIAILEGIQHLVNLVRSLGGKK